MTSSREGIVRTSLLCASLMLLIPRTSESQVFPECQPGQLQLRISRPASWADHFQNRTSALEYRLDKSQLRLLNYSSSRRGDSILPTVSAMLFMSHAASGADLTKEDRCLRAGKTLGAISGSSMGLFALYLGIKGDDMEGPFWKTLAISIPTIAIGAYVGARGTEWATRQIMKSHPKVAASALKGVAYGVVDGALIGIANMVPLLTLGHLIGAINFSDDVGILEVIATSTFGGAIFGGMIGATVGLVYGPAISLYMKY